MKSKGHIYRVVLTRESHSELAIEVESPDELTSDQILAIAEEKSAKRTQILGPQAWKTTLLGEYSEKKIQTNFIQVPVMEQSAEQDEVVIKVDKRPVATFGDSSAIAASKSGRRRHK